MKKVNELAGTKESDTGLAVPALWDLAADRQVLQTEEPLQVRKWKLINQLSSLVPSPYSNYDLRTRPEGLLYR